MALAALAVDSVSGVVDSVAGAAALDGALVSDGDGEGDLVGDLDLDGTHGGTVRSGMTPSGIVRGDGPGTIRTMPLHRRRRAIRRHTAQMTIRQVRFREPIRAMRPRSRKHKSNRSHTQSPIQTCPRTRAMSLSLPQPSCFTRRTAPLSPQRIIGLLTASSTSASPTVARARWIWINSTCSARSPRTRSAAFASL